jgi:tRNA(Ile)-lysidine synthase
MEQNIDVLLMAHHLDDQIETALMRQRRSKPAHANARLSTTGLAGMRGCRRWGMGDRLGDEMRFYGIEGMSRWISRPLLTFPKVRQG